MWGTMMIVFCSWFSTRLTCYEKLSKSYEDGLMLNELTLNGRVLPRNWHCSRDTRPFGMECHCCWAPQLRERGDAHRVVRWATCSLQLKPKKSKKYQLEAILVSSDHGDRQLQHSGCLTIDCRLGTLIPSRALCVLRNVMRFA